MPCWQLLLIIKSSVSQATAAKNILDAFCIWPWVDLEFTGCMVCKPLTVVNLFTAPHWVTRAHGGGGMATVEELCQRWWSHGLSDPLPQLPWGGLWVSASGALCVFTLVASLWHLKDTISEAGILVMTNCSWNFYKLFISLVVVVLCVFMGVCTEAMGQLQVSFFIPGLVFRYKISYWPGPHW